jgi:hypothetical protein
MKPGIPGQTRLKKFFSGLHHVGPDRLSPSVFVQKYRRFRGIHAGSQLSGELQHVAYGDFGGDFFAPALFLEVNHFCFPTEWICLT